MIQDFTKKYQESKRNSNFITKELFLQLKSELKKKKGLNPNSKKIKLLKKI